MKLSRRDFARLLGAAGAGTAVAPLAAFHSRKAYASGGSCDYASFAVNGFGPLGPVVPNNTANLGNVAGAGDLRNVALLQLPPGFQYTAISIRGDTMTDGNIVPGDHDGMAVFSAPNGNMTLVRNHELSILENEAGNRLGCVTANGRTYDPFAGSGAGTGAGGTSTLTVNRNGLVVEDYVSLGGTIRNCAGGPTKWNSWISCEENVTTPATDARATLKHGYNFEVPAFLGEAVDPVPLIDMGRMNHEAITVDPWSYEVFQTEDRGDGCYYRFIPNKIDGDRALYAQGGALYAMVIRPGQRSQCTGELIPTTNFNGTQVVDTRGLGRGGAGSMLPFIGQDLAVDWVRLDDVDPEQDTLRSEAKTKGAAIFWRGEGAWEHRGMHYWVGSGAGDAAEGQVWQYNPATNTVRMLVEATNSSLLDNPDNMTVASDGTMYLAEDGGSTDRIVGVELNGGLFDFALNNINTSEFCGPCFSADGKYFFFNEQGIGITYCVWRTDGSAIRLG